MQNHGQYQKATTLCLESVEKRLEKHRPDKGKVFGFADPGEVDDGDDIHRDGAGVAVMAELMRDG